MKSRIKSTAKKFVKKSLIVSKNVLVKNRHIRRVGKGLRNVLFPGGANPNIYDWYKYSPTIPEYQKQVQGWKGFKHKPLISLIMPTYNTPITYLEECIESVQLQSYPNWELCIADDASPNKDVAQTIKRYAKEDNRIKFVQRKKNGHISAATNSALEIATGEFSALLDHDDVIWPNALYEIVAAINRQPDVDLVYTDEDKIDSDNKIHSYPVFKPDWSPEFLESCNYITHFACMRTKLLNAVGGLRVGYEGAQDWDLFLRITEKTDKIVHIPKVVYSWRIHEASTALNTDTKPYVYEAQRKLLEDHVERMGLGGVVRQGIIKQHSSIQYGLIDEPLVSVVVYGPKTEMFKRCVESIFRHTTYKNFETVLVAASPAIESYCKQVAKKHKECTVEVVGGASAPNALNRVVPQTKGDYVVLVDATTVPITAGWLELMLADVQRQGIAAVGGKTISSDKTRIMRAGVAMGVYGLYAPLLEGMPTEDVHYMRGLYGQSRRNTAAVDSGCIMLDKGMVRKLGSFDESLGDMFIVDYCLRALQDGSRIVYNPFVESVDQRDLTAGDASKKRNQKVVEEFQKKWARYIEDDPYFNPNYTRCNAQLDIN